jgi:hypothetical protein
MVEGEASRGKNEEYLTPIIIYERPSLRVKPAGEGTNSRSLLLNRRSNEVGSRTNMKSRGKLFPLF